MSRDARGPAHERPIRVQPTGRTGARHRLAASPARPHVYYRPTPHGRRVTIANLEALTADERADIAEAADHTEAAGGSADGDRLRVNVSPSLEADAVYVEDVGMAPTLVLRPDRSPEHAVVAVTYCVPGMSPLEARRLVDAHFPGDGVLFHPASTQAESTSGTRTGPRRARMLMLGALAGAAALAAGVMANGSDGPSTPGVSGDVDRSSWGAMPARSAMRSAAQSLASPSAQAVDRASESVSAKITPIYDPLDQDTYNDESAPTPTSEEDDSPADTSADSTTSSDPSESPAAPEPSDPGPEQDESDESDGLLDVIGGLFD